MLVLKSLICTFAEIISVPIKDVENNLQSTCDLLEVIDCTFCKEFQTFKLKSVNDAVSTVL